MRKVFHKNQDGGVALVLVIWIIVVLIAIVGEFSYSMRTEINIARNFKEEEEAYNLALSGIEQARAEVLTAKDLSRMFMNEEDVLVLDPDAAEPPARNTELGRGRFEYVITDEEGKMNINKVSRDQIRALFNETVGEIEDIDTVLDSIEDWIDDDVLDGPDLHRASGAEDDYYEELDRPYSAKDGPFDSPEELLLVKGMTPEFFQGSREVGEEGEYEGVGKYLTVYGTGAVNTRTAPKTVLEIMYPGQADSIMEQRKSGAPTAGGGAVSKFFRIVSTGYSADGEIRRTIRTIFKKNMDKLETVYWNDNTV
ncbi:MAG: general secretion pathway protein GspK [Nitrospirae bacterium]|nr:general secretion pathway protein GspK [Nitrospirota bacterium]